MIARALIFAGLVVLAGSANSASAASITPATVQLIDAWVQAVHKHVPGTPDESVAVVRRLTYQDRVAMNAGIDLFFQAVRGLPFNTGGNRAAEQLAGLGRGAGMPDAAGFARHAAILHTDAVVFAERFPQPPDSTIPSPGTVRPSGSAGTNSGLPITFRTPEQSVPPLLTNVPFVMHKDGEVLGTAYADWNWVFARSLLDVLDHANDPLAPADPFVGTWYHATTAYMLADGLYGDATDHLHHAGEVLPNDALIAFDRASYAEILGLPPHQVLLADWKPGTMNPRVPPLDKTNAEAERLFRRALELDPSFVEARVRLGRLLDVRGAHAEGLAELKTALAANPKPIVTFYAHLFAARASQALGDVRGAAVHYADALASYPHAQSALLGASQAALLAADVSGASAPIERLGPASAPFEADPWRAYQLAAGRDVNDLMHQMWAMTR